MSEVWLIRHGQSEANAGLRSATAAGIPLTALGVKQAQAVAQCFDAPPARIIVSPYLRAVQSAAATEARFPAVPSERWPVQEFTFLAAARCRDTTSAERLPLVQQYWARADPSYRDSPEVETFHELLARVDAALARLRALEGRVAVFTHGQWIQTALWRLGQGPQPSGPGRMAALRAFMHATPIPNGSVLRVALGAGPAQISAPSIEHLRALPITG